MWTTFPKLFESQSVIQSWGFDYKTCAFVWIKTNKKAQLDQYSFLPQDSFDSFWGMGRWTRSNAEICLLSTRGKPQRASASVHQVIYAPIDKHSKKPAETRNRIVELCGDVPRLEMFCRGSAPGWDVFGNEAENSIEIEHGANQNQAVEHRATNPRLAQSAGANK